MKKEAITRVESIDSAKSVALSGSNVTVITSNGDLYNWGDNAWGQLGEGKYDNYYYLKFGILTNPRNTTPAKIMGGIAAISTATHSAVIDNNGSLYTWGPQICGCLGDDRRDFSETYTPTKINSFSNIKAVLCGIECTGVITSDGSLYMWGLNTYGQTGNGTAAGTKESNDFINKKPLKLLDNVVTASSSNYTTAAVTADGSLYTWGYNGYANLGNGTWNECYTPQKVMSDVVDVAVGSGFMAVIKADGSLYTWGKNDVGQLGDGNPIAMQSKPVKVMDGVVSISAGSSHILALTETGDLYAWGSNEYGQLGDSTLSSSSVPIKVMENVMIPTREKTAIEIKAKLELKQASALKSLGLFKGVTDTEFDLGRSPTRAEALVMLIRLLGKEDEALSGEWKHPFTDAGWADKYIGYAYENGLTNGVSDTLFGSGNSANANMYLTFVLRSLGYSDKNGDFSWDSPFDLAGSVNITTDNLALDNFLRGDVVLISVNALEAKMKGSDQTLASRLIKAGVFTSTQYQAAFSK